MQTTITHNISDSEAISRINIFMGKCDADELARIFEECFGLKTWTSFDENKEELCLVYETVTNTDKSAQIHSH